MAGCIGRLTLPIATLIAATWSVRLANSIWAMRMTLGRRVAKCADSLASAMTSSS